MYKKFFALSFIAAIVSLSNAEAQVSHHPDLVKLDKEAELMLDSAAKHMILFILTKSTSDYDKAQNLVVQGDTLNEKLERKALQDYKLTKLDSYILERDDEIRAYANKDLKAEILSEKTTNEHVHFKGGHYNVGPKAKQRYEEFTEYLPKN
jgi:ribosome-binding ATPase YchF (GTP1/OBG family)